MMTEKIQLLDPDLETTEFVSQKSYKIPWYDYECICIWMGEFTLHIWASVTMVVESRFYLK